VEAAHAHEVEAAHAHAVEAAHAHAVEAAHAHAVEAAHEHAVEAAHAHAVEAAHAHAETGVVTYLPSHSDGSIARVRLAFRTDFLTWNRRSGIYLLLDHSSNGFFLFFFDEFVFWPTNNSFAGVVLDILDLR
jgi:hypothetical protein